MFVRNLLKAGQFVELVPVGLPVTLQFDAKGVIEHIYWGHDDSRMNITAKVLPTYVQERVGPIKIPLQGGTTWVQGVLYSGTLFPANGKLPEATREQAIADFVANPATYSFHAGAAQSTVTRFVGAAATRQWLSGAKFRVLPGFLVPPNMTRDLFQTLMQSAKFDFKSYMVQSYIVFDAKNVMYYNTGLRQVYAGTVNIHNISTGAVVATVTLKGIPEKLTVGYKDVVLHNIHPNTLMVLNSRNKIVHSEPTDTKNRTKRTNELVCAVCGRPYTVARFEADVMCPDEHCLSRAYPRVLQMIQTLNLPEISYEVYIEAVKSKKVLSVLDVFDLDMYKELPVESTVARALRAIVPYAACPSTDLIDIFCNNAGNRISNIRYYLQHPAVIVKDLKIAHLGLPRFVEWLEDPVNAAEAEAIFDIKNLVITGVDRMFNGAPILRNKTIMLTGKFTHGTCAEVARILASYSAKVVYGLHGHIDCVVVGDIPEDVNSSDVRSAKANQVPVMSEKQFFEQFKIDEDLAEHLK